MSKFKMKFPPIKPTINDTFEEKIWLREGENLAWVLFDLIGLESHELTQEILSDIKFREVESGTYISVKSPMTQEQLEPSLEEYESKLKKYRKWYANNKNNIYYLHV